MDIGKAFTYVFEDEDWVKKILIGGIVTIIPIVNLTASGYGLRVLRNVARGDDKPLPEWDDWGGDFVKGLMVVVASLVYSLPAVILASIGAIVAAISSDPYGNLSAVGGVCFAGLQCLSILWAIVVALWMPAAMVRYASAEEFGAFFRLGEIWALISGNPGAYAMAILTTVIAGLVGGLGTLACVVGVIFTAFYATLVGMHALGQVGLEAGPPAAATAFGSASDEDAGF